MGTHLTAPTGFAALSPLQQKEHRAKIGVRVEAILGQFWRDDNAPDAIRALELEGWMDVLEPCSHSELREAWAVYQRTGPRTEKGRLLKPDAGALYRIVMRRRPKPPAPRPAPAPPKRMTGEEAKAVLKSAGVVLNQNGKVVML